MDSERHPSRGLCSFFRRGAESTGIIGIILLLILATWAVPVVIGLLFARARLARSRAFVYVIVIAIQTLTYFAVLKRINEKAVIRLATGHQSAAGITSRLENGRPNAREHKRFGRHFLVGEYQKFRRAAVL